VGYGWGLMTRMIGVRLLLALVSLVFGVLAGLLVLESVLQVNPRLLFRGMALVGTVDMPLSIKEYTVHYSDADAFFWRPDLIRPIPPGQDRVEAVVVYQTDELGFRNPPGLPARVDAVVLGRSISLAAFLPQPWPRLAEQTSGLSLLNLSQPGGNLAVKRMVYQRFGKPRHPHWVILEVAPSLEILEDQDQPDWLVGETLLPLAQGILRRWGFGNAGPSNANAIYPLQVELAGTRRELTCCLHYMEFFSLPGQELERTRAWSLYRQQLEEFAQQLKQEGSCLVLMIAPTKPDIYFPLADLPHQLDEVVRGVAVYQVKNDGQITPSQEYPLTPEMVQQNAFAGRDLILTWANVNDVLVADATPLMLDALRNGQDPFMVYDSHWNMLGHELVSQAVLEVLQKGACR